MSTLSRDIHRPSLAKLWQIPAHTELPIEKDVPPERSTPLEVQATSYLADDVRTDSFSNVFTLFSPRGQTSSKAVN